MKAYAVRYDNSCHIETVIATTSRAKAFNYITAQMNCSYPVVLKEQIILGVMIVMNYSK